MSDCEQCKMHMEKNWLFCPYCGSFASTPGSANKSEKAKPSSKAGSSPTRNNPPGSATSGLAPYGQGVRAQVFEVIVRQGIAGAPWREICSGPMIVNNIDPDEIQAEIDRRTGGDGGGHNSPVPKKPRSPFGEWFDSLKNPNPTED